MSTQPTQQGPLAARANRVNGRTLGRNVHRLGLAPRAAAGILFLALQGCAGVHEDVPLAPQRAAMAPRHAVGISFERGSAKPPAAAASVLAGLAQRGRLAPLIVVDGYARRGGADNLALAHQRALAVKDELVARGLDEKRIRTNAATSENADPLRTRVEVRLVARTRTPGL